MKTINVTNIDITIIKQKEVDYISLTDMIKAKDGDFFITDWLRNRNTLDYLAAWEQMHNPNFNYGEFAVIRNSSGTNIFKISVKEWVEKTGAIGLTAKAGRYGGTYAHEDIAFEFGTWISPIFKLYLIKEFQRLKEQESKQLNTEWDYRRFLTKVNYKLHTDAVKEIIIPKYKNLTREEERYIYADEAEMINSVVFGETSKEWRKDHQKEYLDGHNMRTFATIPQLTVLSNVEVLSNHLIKEGLSAEERYKKLKNMAVSQFQSLSNIKYSYPIDSPHIAKYEQSTTFDQNLKGLLNTPPPKKDKK